MNSNQARNWQRNYEQVSQAQPEQKKVIIKVRKSSWLTKGEKVIYAGFGAFLIAAGIYIVSFSSSTDTLNREIQTIEANVQQQKVENETLMFQKDELSKPERITEIAKENGLKIQATQVKRAQLETN